MELGDVIQTDVAELPQIYNNRDLYYIVTGHTPDVEIPSEEILLKLLEVDRHEVKKDIKFAKNLFEVFCSDRDLGSLAQLGFRYDSLKQARRAHYAFENQHRHITPYRYPEDVRMTGLVPVGWLDDAIGADEVFTMAEADEKEKMIRTLNTLRANQQSNKKNVKFRDLLDLPTTIDNLPDNELHAVTGGGWGDYGSHPCSLEPECSEKMAGVYAMKQEAVSVMFPAGIIHYISKHNWKPDPGFAKMLDSITESSVVQHSK